jgi:high affinity Mn2+ porin
LKNLICILLSIGALIPIPAAAQDAAPSPSPDNQNWDLHFQSTLIGQGALPFAAEYSGPNSLEPHGEVKDTLSLDVTGGVRAWHGGEFYADILMWQGYGLSNTLGAAGFPNGEAFRIGKTYPDASVSRAFFRETMGMGGGEETVEDSAFELGGSRDQRRLTLTVGHLSAKDIFDTNTYANEPRSQFMNWALMANLAWDYPANTLGFTNGAAVEFTAGLWTGRLGIFQVSQTANGVRMDWDLGRAYSAAAEVERRYALARHSGAVRFLAYRTRAHMGNYQETLNDPSLAENIELDGQNRYRSKYGFGINMEQEIRKDLGAFLRLGWSDGKNQTWEFTDVDRTASAGLSLKGSGWCRPGDTVGFGAVINGISAAHRQFLAAGGLGITVGDGALDYRSERLAETYYNWKLSKHYQLTLDYQFAKNPAYNHERGPIHLIATRLHAEF